MTDGEISAGIDGPPRRFCEQRVNAALERHVRISETYWLSELKRAADGASTEDEQRSHRDGNVGRHPGIFGGARAAQQGHRPRLKPTSAGRRPIMAPWSSVDP